LSGSDVKATPEIIEVYGDIHARHCSNNCIDANMPGVDHKFSNDVVPRCHQCGGNSRPYFIFFDEQLDRFDPTVNNIEDTLKGIDCIVIVDCQLDSNLELKIIDLVLKQQNISIIEIGKTHHLEYGNVKQLKGTGSIVSELIEKALKLANRQRKPSDNQHDV